VAEALKERASAYLQEQEEMYRAQAAELGIAEDLVEYDRLSLPIIVALGRGGVKTLEDLADLAGDELVEMAPDSGLDAALAGDIVLDARRRLGWIADEETPPEAAEGDGAA
jgi:transcription termination/antitermination protein NusA